MISNINLTNINHSILIKNIKQDKKNVRTYSAYASIGNFKIKGTAIFSVALDGLLRKWNPVGTCEWKQKTIHFPNVGPSAPVPNSYFCTKYQNGSWMYGKIKICDHFVVTSEICHTKQKDQILIRVFDTQVKGKNTSQILIQQPRIMMVAINNKIYVFSANSYQIQVQRYGIQDAKHEINFFFPINNSTGFWRQSSFYFFCYLDQEQMFIIFDCQKESFHTYVIENCPKEDIPRIRTGWSNQQKQVLLVYNSSYMIIDLETKTIKKTGTFNNTASGNGIGDRTIQLYGEWLMIVHEGEVVDEKLTLISLINLTNNKEMHIEFPVSLCYRIDTDNNILVITGEKNQIFFDLKSLTNIKNQKFDYNATPIEWKNGSLFYTQERALIRIDYIPKIKE